jgi:type IV pilus assembly protein PilA
MLKFIKNNKGLTLVELLAVIVILGIIAAIATPAILGIIDKSKKDAHVANAHQMVSSAQVFVSSESQGLAPADGATVDVSLKYLIDNGYMDTIADPDKGTYALGTGTVTGFPTGKTDGSYVEISRSGNTFTYKVKLIESSNSGRGVQSAAGSSTSLPVLSTSLSRDYVFNN